MEVDTVQERLSGFRDMAGVFGSRRPLAAPDQEVALILPYNGSAWLNTAIVSIYLVGNRVRVKFASRDSHISHLTESLYRPIFGEDIVFEYASGLKFMQQALESPDVVAICMFGSERHALSAKLVPQCSQNLLSRGVSDPHWRQNFVASTEAT